jgi:hypothetical protein
VGGAADEAPVSTAELRAFMRETTDALAPQRKHAARAAKGLAARTECARAALMHPGSGCVITSDGTVPASDVLDPDIYVNY